MKSVTDFLARFKKITPPDDALRKVIAHVITEITRVPVTTKDVEVRNSIAFISASSIAKSVIRTARASILAGIAREVPSAGKSVRDIR